MKQQDPFFVWDFEYAFKFRKSEEKFDKLWQMKASARESLKDWLLVSEIAPKSSEICANACSELIENCIRYSYDDAMAAVRIQVTNTEITVETLNWATPANRAILLSALEELQGDVDPKEIFVKKLLNPVEGVSQLGLIKVVMETRGTLELVPESDDELIHIQLQMRV